MALRTESPSAPFEITIPEGVNLDDLERLVEDGTPAPGGVSAPPATAEPVAPVAPPPPVVDPARPAPAVPVRVLTAERARAKEREDRLKADNTRLREQALNARRVERMTPAEVRLDPGKMATLKSRAEEVIGQGAGQLFEEMASMWVTEANAAQRQNLAKAVEPVETPADRARRLESEFSEKNGDYFHRLQVSGVSAALQIDRSTGLSIEPALATEIANSENPAQTAYEIATERMRSRGIAVPEDAEAAPLAAAPVAPVIPAAVAPAASAAQPPAVVEPRETRPAVPGGRTIRHIPAAPGGPGKVIMSRDQLTRLMSVDPDKYMALRDASGPEAFDAYHIGGYDFNELTRGQP